MKLHFLRGALDPKIPTANFSLCGKAVFNSRIYTKDRYRFRRAKNRCGACMRSAVASWGWKPTSQPKCKPSVVGGTDDRRLIGAFCDACGFSATSTGLSGRDVLPLIEREHRAHAERQAKVRR